MSPHARVAVGLQFERHGGAVGPHAPCTYAVARTEQILDVVTELVRDHVGLREIARGTKARGEILEEAEIEIDLVVRRTVERSGRTFSGATPRLRCVTEQHHLRHLVATAQELLPGGLRVARDSVDHVGHPLFVRRGLKFATLLVRLRRRQASAVAEQREKVRAGRPTEHHQEHDTTETKLNAAAHSASGTGALVLDVAAIAFRPTHD